MRLMKISLVGFASLLCVCAYADVNLNTADHQQLMEQLRNVGSEKAAAIIEYRERNGRFTDVGQLTGVSGIGEATLEMNRHLLTVGDDAGGGGDGREILSGPSSDAPPALREAVESATGERLPAAGH